MCQHTLTESSAMVANCGRVRKGAGTAGDAILEEGFLVVIVVVVGGKGGESEWDELAGETGKRGNGETKGKSVVLYPRVCTCDR